ncbi:hypothetical protein H4R34_003593 [Dimargaris verticillata]|uniref:BED-type domain-containing protein n=1 Tax=Dimargaris verticillata TaxID=2761393 RepID=A0A9W8B6K1_9FUNG|nr:hypothetical protein H4R34_003593 [Dimargaris verticillata]
MFANGTPVNPLAMTDEAAAAASTAATATIGASTTGSDDLRTPKRQRTEVVTLDENGDAKIIPYTPFPVDKLREAAEDDGSGTSLLSPATLQKRLIRQKVIDGIYTLLPPPSNHHSVCWERFNYVADENGNVMPYTCCKICKDVYTYKGKDTGTKGMIHHRCKRIRLQDGGQGPGAEIGITPNMVEGLLGSRRGLGGDGTSAAGSNQVCSRLAELKDKASDPAVSAALASELLAQALDKSQSVYVPVTPEVRQVILQSCVNFICQDMRPVDTMVDEDFLDLLQTAINLGAKFGHFDVTRILLPNNNAADSSAAAAVVNGGINMSATDPNNKDKATEATTVA